MSIFSKWKKNESVELDEIDGLDELSLDKLDQEDMVIEPERHIPIRSRIGFLDAGITKSEVLQAIRNIAENDFGAKKGVYYNIIKHNGGFLYEIHQGCKYGVLKEIIKKVGPEKDMLLETNDAVYRIYEKQSTGRISTLKLRENDPNIDSFEKLSPSGEISPLETTGYWLYMFGISVATLGVIGLSLSSAAKHFFIDQEESIIFDQSGKVTPSSYINSIRTSQEALNPETDYILYVSYSEKEDWTLKTGTINTQIEASGELIFRAGDEVVDINEGKEEVSNEVPK